MEECEGAPAARENGGMPGDERLRARSSRRPTRRTSSASWTR